MLKELIKESKSMKRIVMLFVILSAVLISGCDDAGVVSDNLSRAADRFEITRRVVFYNGITGKYVLVIEGLCSVEVLKSQLAVTCKTGATSYKKHYLGLSDNVTYFAEQVESAKTSIYHYRVIFKPQTILPNIDFRGSLE